MNSRRPSSAGQTRYFGRTFTDGDTAESIASSSKKIGGMVARNEAWSQSQAQTKSQSTASVTTATTEEQLRSSKHIYVHRVDSGLSHTQKRASSFNPGDVTKPIFLKRALNFINEELRIIGASCEHAGTPRRFQVFSQVFEQFIQEFRTYEPLLSEIKREYELLIEKQKADLSQFEIVKSKLSVMEFKMARDIEKITDRSNATIEDILRSKQTVMIQLQEKNQENIQLQQRINDLHLQLKKLEKEKNGKTDHTDLTELKAIAAEFTEHEKNTKDIIETKDRQLGELAALKKKLQNELFEATSAMGKLKASMVGYTKESFKELEKKLSESVAKTAKLAEEKEKITAESVELAKTLKDTRFALQKSKMSQPPDWDYIQAQFTPSIKYYVDIARKPDYNDAIVALIRDALKTTKQPTTAATPVSKEENIIIPPEPKSLIPSNAYSFKKEDEYFTGKGLQSSIPKYLRTKQKVLNRHLSRHNTLLLIKDTWEAKVAYQSSSNSKIMLGDFLYLYLKKRFGNQEVICEWGYNLTEACAKYKDSSVECSFFLDILSDNLGEEVFECLVLFMEYFKNAVYRWDVDCNFGTAKGFLEKNEFIQLLNQLFPEKSKKQIQSLEDALNMDQSSEMIIYRFIFDAEADSQLLNTLKKQLHEDREMFIKELEQAIAKLSRDDTMSAFEADRMMRELDPQKKQDDIEKLLARGFGVELSNLKPKLLVVKKKFVENLKRVPLAKGNSSYISC